MPTLGERIKEERLIRKMTQTELGNICGVTKYTISLYESNKSTPNDDIKKVIANYFKVSIDYLLGVSNIKNPYLSNENNLDIPKEYTDKYTISKRDIKQHKEFIKEQAQALFMNNEVGEEDKQEIIDIMNEIFWKAKLLNKRKPKDK